MTVKEELIQMINYMNDENILETINFIKNKQYLDEALKLEEQGEIVCKTLDQLKEFEK